MVPARFNINKTKDYPTNTIAVGRERFNELNVIAQEFKEGLIDEWTYAAKCRLIEPKLQMFRDNNLVVYERYSR